MSALKATIVAQVLVITGQRVIPVKPYFVAQIISALFFLTISIFTVFVYRKYRLRIRHLLVKRGEVLTAAGISDPFPSPTIYGFSPYRLYVVLIISLSIVGCALVKFGVPVQSPDLALSSGASRAEHDARLP